MPASRHSTDSSNVGHRNAHCTNASMLLGSSVAFIRYGTASFGLRLLHSASAISRLPVSTINQQIFDMTNIACRQPQTRTFAETLRTPYRRQSHVAFLHRISANAWRDRQDAYVRMYGKAKKLHPKKVVSRQLSRVNLRIDILERLPHRNKNTN